MSITKNNKGFGILPVIIVLALIGLLLVAGIRINNNNNNSEKASTTTQTVNDIKSTTDELDSVNLEQDLDTAEIDEDIQAVL